MSATTFYSSYTCLHPPVNYLTCYLCFSYISINAIYATIKVKLLAANVLNVVCQCFLDVSECLHGVSDIRRTCEARSEVAWEAGDWAFVAPWQFGVYGNFTHT